LHRIEIVMNAEGELNKTVQSQQAFNQDVLNIDVIWSNKEISQR